MNKWESVWDREYNDPKLLTLSNEATKSFKDFVRWLRRDQKIDLDTVRALDLGCGNGKHSIYLAEQSHANIVGIDISGTAIDIAQKMTEEKGLTNQISFHVGSIGQKIPWADQSFTLAIDSTSSHLLNSAERNIFLTELVRVLAKDGYLFLRTLCKDGDKNAQKLIDEHPGKDIDSYVMPQTGFVEHIWSEIKLREAYEPFFEIMHLEKEEHYTKMNGRSYKRMFWVVYAVSR